MLTDRLRLATLVVALIGAGSVMLPWIHLPKFGAVNGLDNNRGLTLACAFAACFVLTLTFRQGRAVLLAVGLLGLSVVTLAGLQVAGYWELIERFRAEGDPAERSVGVGLYLTVVCGVVVVGLTLWRLWRVDVGRD